MTFSKFHAAIAAVALSGAGIAAAPLLAQDEAALPGQVDVARVAAGTYAADPAHTLVGFRVNHFGFTDYFGIFGSITGTLELDPANPAASKLDVTIPISAVTVAEAELKDHLLRPGADGAKPDFFGPSPADAHFVSTKVEKTGETTANVYGDLTMNGVTRPVLIAAEFTGAGTNPMTKAETIGFHGRATLLRSQFGVAAFIPYVSDKVTLDIEGAFEKQ